MGNDFPMQQTDNDINEMLMICELFPGWERSLAVVCHEIMKLGDLSKK